MANSNRPTDENHGGANRFKAISTGAGVYNWISMYGESDTQRGRQWYLGDKMYWDDMEHWRKQSPRPTSST
ncbi:hypothetical protein BH11GEM1_BH11GEM1_10870 [soil metagenome]